MKHSTLTKHKPASLLIISFLLCSALGIQAQDSVRFPLSALGPDGSQEWSWTSESYLPALLPKDCELSSFEADVIALVNQERIGRGIAPLAINDALMNAARGHSQDMSDHDFFSHIGSDGSTFTQRIARAGYLNLCTGGENIAAGYSSPQAVFDAWMNSAGHRANMLNSNYRDIGVGYVYEPDDQYPNPWGYQHYWTQDFGSQDCGGPTPTMPPSATPTRTRTPTPTFSPTATLWRTATFSPTPSPTATMTRTATPTPTPSPTATLWRTATFSPTPSPTATMTRTATPTNTATEVPQATPTPSTVVGAATLIGSVELQGRPPKPNAGWRVPLLVAVLKEGLPVSQPVVVYTDENGQFVLSQIAPGLYDIRIKNLHTLANIKRAAQLASGPNYITFGALLEGDASNDNIIDILDFSLLRAVFGTTNPQADFNHDGVVDVLDFSLLRSHFGLAGDILVL